MKIQLKDGLPFVSMSLTYRGQALKVENVLIDTGSASTVFSTDKLLTIGLWYDMDDMAHRLHGIGGAEFVFAKRIDQLSLEDMRISDFEIEVGALGYGFDIDGIVGMDFLRQVGAAIDLDRMEIYRAAQ